MRNNFSSWSIMQFLEKLWKMWENIEILNLSQLKGEEKKLFSIRTKLLSHKKIFHRKPIGNKNEKTQILMNIPICLGLSILDLSKTSMYEFWHDYLKPRFGENVTLLYVYKQLYYSRKNWWYLQIHCQRCQNKIWHFKFWNRQNFV